MTNKKYQIFVSSTYEDLKEERKAVIEQILNMGHLPIGMELFVASDDEQFSYIKRIIDNCDYYVLILGGRYGSISPNTGISYTEMEYNYAVEKNIPVLVFPYINIEKLSVKKKDKDLTRITNFINKATNSRVRKTWKNKDNLCLNVMNSLYKNFDDCPQRGWIRPDEYDNSKLLTQLNELIQKNSELETEIKNYKKQLIASVGDIANLDEVFELHYKYEEKNSSQLYNSKISVTWNEIFSYIGPELISPIPASSIRYKLDKNFINKYSKKSYTNTYLDEDDVNTIKIQLMTLGLIDAFSGKSVNGGMNEYAQLTKKGLSHLKQIKTIKTNKDKN